MPLIPMTIQEQIARQIIMKRDWFNLSQAELAQKVGTSRSAIARLEHAEGNPTVDLIQRVVDILKIDFHLYIRPSGPIEHTDPKWLPEPKWLREPKQS